MELTVLSGETSLERTVPSRIISWSSLFTFMLRRPSIIRFPFGNTSTTRAVMVALRLSSREVEPLPANFELLLAEINLVRSPRYLDTTLFPSKPVSYTHLRAHETDSYLV